ncbi:MULTISPECIES: hypothetical protein [Photorhabdus]|uniref:Uncharacterized protein n=1 Tax=Photorhabdus temperata subsp. temperata Meg1 TaxID=1393735 RepID=A0A081RQY5_PHOTE|nr:MULTISPECIES: hypothetical protein [Photorhabdus]KER01088.1 hypothetical protein MEG1DRAFT_04298 [Photorhabdus temperata subsp. temperata Meg1]MCC8421964.1 hypothetical protein [Photorhabdus thracensis]
MENIKFAHQSFSENGIRFYLSTDGTIYVSTKIHKMIEIVKLTYPDTGKPWIPIFKNFRSLCKQMLREGDLHKIEKELKKHAKLCSVLKQHQIQLYELILEKDFNEAYKLCMDIKHESGN